MGGRTATVSGTATAEARRVVFGWLVGRNGLAVHAGIFLLAAVTFTLLNVALAPGHLWIWRPLGWWGALLAIHAAFTLARGGVIPIKRDRSAPTVDVRQQPTADFSPPFTSAESRERFLHVRQIGRWLRERRVAIAPRRPEREVAAFPALPPIGTPAVGGERSAGGGERLATALRRTSRRLRGVVQERLGRTLAELDAGSAPASSLEENRMHATWPSAWGHTDRGDSPVAPVHRRTELPVDDSVSLEVAALWGRGIPAVAPAVAGARRKISLTSVPVTAALAAPASRPAVDGFADSADVEARWGSLQEEAGLWLARRQGAPALAPPGEMAAESIAASGD